MVLVHLSPANGEEDIKIANKRKVKVFSPIDDEVKFTVEAGAYQGLFVRDADRPIVEDIKECNALVRIGKNQTQVPSLPGGRTIQLCGLQEGDGFTS